MSSATIVTITKMIETLPESAQETTRAAAHQQMNENSTQIFRISADVFAFYLRHLR
jgi:hypothetical protein